MNADVFRVYEPGECGTDGYPLAWHDLGDGRGVKHLVREAAGNRCVRCGHPFVTGESSPDWSPCDERCTHAGPMRWSTDGKTWEPVALRRGGKPDESIAAFYAQSLANFVQAKRRVLTVHHLRVGFDFKRDLRWWNLAALCQRCHLQIQGRVRLERIWPWPHSDWFRPYAAGWYAWSYLGEDLSRAEVEERMDELLALELA